MVAVVNVEICWTWLVGSHLNHIRDHDGHPDRDRRRRVASRFGLRRARLAATKDLHHFLGHQPGHAPTLRLTLPRFTARAPQLAAEKVECPPKDVSNQHCCPWLRGE